MYRQIEITMFFELKLLIQKAKKAYESIIRIVFKNLRLQFLRRKSDEQHVTDTYLHSSNSVAISYPSRVPNTAHSLPDNTNDQNNSILQECLNKMPRIQRNAFVYKTFEGKKTSLICTDLDINEAVFWRLIQNARKELIDSLDLT